MEFTFADVLVMLFVVAGATKAASYFLAAARNMTLGERRSVVFKAIAVQAIVLGLFALRGKNIMGLFHVSLGALELAGGVILFVFALDLVLGHGGDHGDDASSGDMAFYPLAVPLLASPQAIVATVIIFAKAPEGHPRVMALLALGIVILANLVILLAVAQFMGKGGSEAKSGGGGAQVLLRVVAILLCALAVELMAMGLREYGVIGPAPAGPHAKSGGTAMRHITGGLV
jgi:multiple antibiotic resistance protein